MIVITKKQIALFLLELKEKMKSWEILFLDKKNNSQTLASLELVPDERIKILEKLEIEDYYENPMFGTQIQGQNVWVFRRLIRRREIIIEVAIGNEGTRVICISFYVRQHSMS